MTMKGRFLGGSPHTSIELVIDCWVFQLIPSGLAKLQGGCMIQ